jgi:hypothetical protein
MFWPVVLFNGRVKALWKKTVRKDRIVMEVEPFLKFSKKEEMLVLDAAQPFGVYAGKPVEVRFC